MSVLNFNRDAVAKTATTLTDSPDVHTLILKDEYTPALPSFIDLKRKLPGTNGTVQRSYITRRKAFIIDAGKETERTVIASAKLEVNRPVGVSDADMDILLDDLVGVRESTTFTELLQFGIINVQ